MNKKTKQRKLNPYWVTGITDSEGNFSINYNSNSDKISASFKVTQKFDSVTILYNLKEFFQAGSINIDNRKANAYKFVINKYEIIRDKIIPHFDQYPLLGSKMLDYLDFKKAVLLFEDNKRLLNKKDILSLKKGMNKNRSFDDRWNYLNNKSIIINPNWLQAFVDGEGSFQFNISNTINRNKPIISTSATLEIAQNTHDVKLLNEIKNYFKSGYLKPKFEINCLDEAKKVRSVSRYISYDYETFIKFFEEYPLYTTKNLDFLDWKLLTELKRNKGNLEEITLIKQQMNRGRLLDSHLISPEQKILLSNLI